MHSLVALDIALLALRLAIGAWATRELIWRKHEPFAAPGQHSWDAGLMYTVIPLSLLLLGPGRLSLDHLLIGI